MVTLSPDLGPRHPKPKTLMETNIKNNKYELEPFNSGKKTCEKELTFLKTKSMPTQLAFLVPTMPQPLNQAIGMYISNRSTTFAGVVEGVIGFAL